MVENGNGWAAAEDSGSEKPSERRTRSKTASAKKARSPLAVTPTECVKAEVVGRSPRKQNQRRGSEVKEKQKRKALILYDYDDKRPSKKRKHQRVDNKIKSKQKRKATLSKKQKRKAIVVYDYDDDDDDDDDDEDDEDFPVSVHPKRRMIEGKRDPSEELKIWDFYIRPERHFRARVGLHTNTEAVKMLKQKLNETQIKMFRETCFGYFLDLPEVILQPQLIHSLLLREVFQERDDELWILVNGVRLRFGVGEFALITGLKCTGDAHKRHDCKESSRLIDSYFPEMPKVTKQCITDCFLGQRWTSDQDAVKISVLYFIHTFLFSNLPERSVGIGDFELVESGEYETYPWGILVFDATIESLKNALRGTKTMYRVLGFPLALQCWFYECCPYVKDHVAFKVEDKVPRILNWKVRKQPGTSELCREIFNRKLKSRNIFPTQFEESKLDVLDFFNNREDKEVEDGDDAELYLCNDEFTPSDPSRNQIKAKADPPLNNVDWRSELKRLSVGQLELKEEVKLLNKEVASFKGYIQTSFSNVFKAIESLSKNQGGNIASEFFEQHDRGNDHHIDSDNDSGGFDDSEGDCSDDDHHGNDVMVINDNSDEDDDGSIEGVSGNAEGGKTLADPADEVNSMDICETVPHTCEGSSEKSILKGKDPFDGVGIYSDMLKEFGSWVDKETKKI